MGNLFIGFPVPRAKIAEMIEGSAPPLEHIANHLPDGSDPLILPGDIATGQIIKWNGSKFIGATPAAGGIATRYADTDKFWYTNFESLDGFEIYQSAGASVTLSQDFVWLQTGTTINHLARVRKRDEIGYPVLSWNNVRKFRCRASLHTENNVTGDIFLGVGAGPGSRHIGFIVDYGILKGSVHNGTSGAEIELETLDTPTYSPTKLLEAVFTPGSKAEFYVDGEKLGEITTYLPSGLTDANWWFYAYIKNIDGVNDLWLRISQFEATQAL